MKAQTKKTTGNVASTGKISTPATATATATATAQKANAQKAPATANTVPAKGAVQAQKATPSRNRVPTAPTLRKLRESGTKAMQKIAEKDSDLANRKKAAVEGIKKAVTIVGTEVQNEGKHSPVGHLANCLNGQFDIGILTTPIEMGPDGIDFITWVEKVAKAGCASRKTALTDNEGLIKRLQSHFKSLAGTKASTKLKDRLANVGKADKVEELFACFEPASRLFDDFVTNGQF